MLLLLRGLWCWQLGPWPVGAWCTGILGYQRPSGHNRVVYWCESLDPALLPLVSKIPLRILHMLLPLEFII